MNILLQPPGTKLEPRQRFVLWNIGWDAYEKINEALNEQHVRSTYDRGDLELISPLPIHEAALPYLPVPEIMPLMNQSLHVRDDRERFRILRRWARERALPLRQAWEQQQTPPPGANP